MLSTDSNLFACLGCHRPPRHGGLPGPQGRKPGQHRDARVRRNAAGRQQQHAAGSSVESSRRDSGARQVVKAIRARICGLARANSPRRLRSSGVFSFRLSAGVNGTSNQLGRVWTNGCETGRLNPCFGYS